MAFEDLTNLTEAELALLLGVNSCTVRRWHKSQGLPSHGYRATKRFDWTRVREWHLEYRVKIALSGGAQLDTLNRKLREIRRKSAEVAKASVTSKFTERLNVLRRDQSAELGKLRAEVDGLRPRRRRRQR